MMMVRRLKHWLSDMAYKKGEVARMEIEGGRKMAAALCKEPSYNLVIYALCYDDSGKARTSCVVIQEGVCLDFWLLERPSRTSRTESL